MKALNEEKELESFGQNAFKQKLLTDEIVVFKKKKKDQIINENMLIVGKKALK
jgi:hypothetical protein